MTKTAEEKNLPKEVNDFIEKEAEKIFPWIPTKNKNGEEIEQRVGQNPHNWTKHLKQQKTFKAGFTLCYNTYVEPLKEENERLREALKYLMEGVSGLPPLTAIEGVLIPHYEKAKEALSQYNHPF